jgi:hypothetical protein
MVKIHIVVFQVKIPYSLKVVTSFLEEHIPFIVRVDGDVGSSSEILVIGTM